MLARQVLLLVPQETSLLLGPEQEGLLLDPVEEDFLLGLKEDGTCALRNRGGWRAAWALMQQADAGKRLYTPSSFFLHEDVHALIKDGTQSQ